MSNIALNQQFQEKIFARIRDSIGDLMADEDLKKLVEATIQKAFFEERVDYARSNSYNTYKLESVFVEQVRELLKEPVSQAVREYMSENREAIFMAIQLQLSQAFPAMLMGMVKSIADNNSYAIINELKARGVLP